MACYETVVPPEGEGLRADELIRRYLPELPASEVMKSFRRRDVKADEQRVRQDARLKAGTRLRVYCMEQAEPALRIVYEDADALIVDKKAGMSVLPDGSGGLSLAELAQRHTGGFAAPVHRLDNQTAGLVVIAKRPEAQEILEEVFKKRTLDKRYLCLVRGQPKPAEATCTAWLVKHPEEGRVTVLDHEAQGARRIITAYETLEQGVVSRLRVHLITGRTHQIRAHLAALGHPILGDDVYGDRAFNRREKARRLMLCASELTLDTQGRLPQLDGVTFYAECPF